MPRPEGIATCACKPVCDCQYFAGTNAPTRGDCDSRTTFTGARFELAGTNAPTRGDCDLTRLTGTRVHNARRNECPDQRGLRRYKRLIAAFTMRTAGTNAPTRGDCDCSLACVCAQANLAGTNAPTRGDCDIACAACTVPFILAGTNAPTRGDCDIISISTNVPIISAGTNAPTRGDCDSAFTAFMPLLIKPERMPRPEGIATRARYQGPPGTVRAGTNAPTRGDCD